MTPRERTLAALDHREPDRVPFDLGATNVTGIHRVAYDALRAGFGHTDASAILDIRLGLAVVDRPMRDVLGTDAAMVAQRGPAPDRWQTRSRPSGTRASCATSTASCGGSP